MCSAEGNRPRGEKAWGGGGQLSRGQLSRGQLTRGGIDQGGIDQGELPWGVINLRGNCPGRIGGGGQLSGGIVRGGTDLEPKVGNRISSFIRHSKIV